MSGWIKSRRRVVEHPLFKGDVAKLGAWMWLLNSACYRPTKFNVNGRIIEVQRGQICVSMRGLAEAWGWSKSSVERFITRLKTETMIETEGGTGRLVITICNYERFQSDAELTGTGSGTPRGTGAGQERDTNKEDKKYNNKHTTTDSAREASDNAETEPPGNRPKPNPDFELIMRAANWTRAPTDLAKLIGEWKTDGIDIETAATAIRKQADEMIDRGDPPRLARVFDQAVRERHAADAREIARYEDIPRQTAEQDRQQRQEKLDAADRDIRLANEWQATPDDTPGRPSQRRLDELRQVGAETYRRFGLDPPAEALQHLQAAGTA